MKISLVEICREFLRQDHIGGFIYPIEFFFTTFGKIVLEHTPKLAPSFFAWQHGASKQFEISMIVEADLVQSDLQQEDMQYSKIFPRFFSWFEEERANRTSRFPLTVDHRFFQDSDWSKTEHIGLWSDRLPWNIGWLLHQDDHCVTKEGVCAQNNSEW